MRSRYLRGPLRSCISYIGYANARREVTLAGAQALRLDVQLTPGEGQLTEVEVTGEAERREESRRVGVAELPVENLKQLPTILEPDVFRSLQLLPGIKAASDFSSGLYIRGGSPDQTLILLDRTTVYNPTHFFGLFSTFNPDALKDVRVYKGGYPAEYGGRLGSVVDLYNKDGNRRKLDGSASVGLLASRALIEGPILKKSDGGSRGSFMLAARRSTLEPLLAALNKADIDGLPERFYFYDLNGKVGVDVGPERPRGRERLRRAGLCARAVPDDAKVKLATATATGSVGWTHLFSPRVFSNFTVTGSRYNSNLIFNFAGTEFSRPLLITDFSARGDLEFSPSQQHHLSGGFWTGQFNLDVSRSFDDSTNFRAKINALYAQAYVQERWTPNPFVTVRRRACARATSAMGGFCASSRAPTWRCGPTAACACRRATGATTSFSRSSRPRSSPAPTCGSPPPKACRPPTAISLWRASRPT